jgi:hypothetical protein
MSDERPGTGGKAGRTAVLALLLAAAAGTARGEGEANTGEDFTRPLARADGRIKRQEAAGSGGSWTYTARLDKPFPLSGGWELAMRADVPYATTNAAAPGLPPGERERGWSDALVQALVVTAPEGKSAYAAGAQLQLPTASDPRLGTGKCQLLPSAGIRRDMSRWMKGSWWAFLARQAFDVASKDDARPHISQTYLQPFLNLDLPGAWFITFAPETRYDWRTEKWFVPFDMTAGRMIGAGMVVSLEYKAAIVDDLPLFHQEAEARIGIFF